MIKVAKPTTVPKKLEKEGKRLTEENCADYMVHRNSYGRNKTEFYINPAIYGHNTVKAILKKAQHNKCCYCEKDQIDEPGAVEHYRPKNGYRSNAKEEIKKPGYYWLGYEWSNLYFVCNPCNTHKSYYFPLQDEKKRAKWHKMKIEQETPLLLNPKDRKDPRKHIVFDNHLPRGLTSFGKKTIEICKLDRDDLNQKRQELLKEIDKSILILKTKKNNHKDVVAQAIEFIINCQKPEAKFSATAIDYLKDKVEIASR